MASASVSKPRFIFSTIAALVVLCLLAGAAPVKAAGSSDGTLTTAYGYWDFSMVAGLMDSLLFQVKIEYLYEDEMDGSLYLRTDYEIFTDIDISNGANYKSWDKSEYENLVISFVSGIDWTVYTSEINIEMVIYPLYGYLHQWNTRDYVASFTTPYTYQEAVKFISGVAAPSVAATLLKMNNLYFFPDGGDRSYVVTDEMRYEADVGVYGVDSVDLDDYVSEMGKYTPILQRMWTWFAPLLTVAGIAVVVGIFNTLNNKG